MKTKLEQWQEVRASVRKLNRTMDDVELLLAGKTPNDLPSMEDLFKQFFKGPKAK